MVDHKSSGSQVSVNNNNENYDELYNAFQELYYESEKLNFAHSKLKLEYKSLQKNFEKSLEEEEILKSKISILEDGRNVYVECEYCKEHELKISNLEKSLVNASKVKKC